MLFTTTELVAGMQKGAADTRSGTPGEPARWISPFTKHSPLCALQVSVGAQYGQAGGVQSPASVQLRKEWTEHRPEIGPAVQLPSCAESISARFGRQSPGRQTPPEQSRSLVQGCASNAPFTQAAAHAFGFSGAPPIGGQKHCCTQEPPGQALATVHGAPAFAPWRQRMPLKPGSVQAKLDGNVEGPVVNGSIRTSSWPTSGTEGKGQSTLGVPKSAVGPPKGAFGRHGLLMFGPQLQTGSRVQWLGGFGQSASLAHCVRALGPVMPALPAQKPPQIGQGWL